MANIVRSGGGNPEINEIWSANGFGSNNGDAFMNGFYPISGSETKLSSYDADTYWTTSAVTSNVKLTPKTSGTLHILLVPEVQSSVTSITVKSVTNATYTVKETTADTSTKQRIALEFYLSGVTAGTQITIALCFNFGTIRNIMAIVYDD